MSFDVLFKAGLFPMRTVGDPGAQGAGITGIQGIGVSTPRAAAVAAATCGFSMELHMPKGIIFFMGMLSITVAMGAAATTLFSGVTMKAEGAKPKLQAHIAPMHTHIAIPYPLSTIPSIRKISSKAMPPASPASISSMIKEYSFII